MALPLIKTQFKALNKSIDDMSSLLTDFNSKDFKKGLLRFNEVSAIAVKLIKNTQKNFSKNTPNLQYFNSLLTKFLDHTFGLSQIINNLKKENDACYYLSSAHLISRSQFEVYLMLIYLYFEPTDQDLKDLKFLVYEYAGICKRQEYKPIDEKSLNIYNNDSKDLKLKRDEILNNSHYKSLNRKIRKQILTGFNSKLKSTTYIVKSSPFFKNEIFKKTWSLESNYAHSEFNSAIQIDHYLRNKGEAKSSLKLNITCASIICGALLQDLYEYYAEYFPIKSLNDYEINILRFYKGIAIEESPNLIAY